MANINSFYPPSGGASSNASVGSNGVTAPTSSTEVGFIDGSGNLQGVSSTNPIPATVTSSVLPTGAATAANQVTQEATLTQIEANQTNGTQQTQIVGTVPLPTGSATAALQSNVQSAPGTPQTVALTVQGNASGVAVPISATALPLPTGAATAANQATEITSLATIATNTGAATPAGTNIIGKVGIDQTTPGTTNGVQVNAALPAGTNTLGSVKVTDGTNVATVKAASTAAVASDTAVVVAISPNNALTTASTVKGTVIANAPIQNTYSTTNITTSAYVQLVASTTNTINTIHIFDSSGQAMIFGIGGSGSEVVTLYVPPGGDTYTLNIPSGSRLAYKALSATASSGYLLMSFLE